MGCFSPALLGIADQPIGRTANSTPAPVEHMGVDYPRPIVALAHEFLHRSNVVSVSEVLPVNSLNAPEMLMQ